MTTTPNRPRTSSDRRWILAAAVTWIVGGVAVLGLAVVMGALPIRGRVFSAAAIFTVCAVIAHVVDVQRQGFGWLPHRVVIGVWEIYTAGGMFVYAIREATWFNYQGDVWRAVWVNVIAVVSLWLGYLVTSRWRRSDASRQPTTIAASDGKKVLGGAVVLAGIAWLGAATMYLQAGMLPAFTGQVDSARLVVRSSVGGYVAPMIGCGMLAIGFAALLVFAEGYSSRQRALAFVTGAVAVAPLLAYGGRFFVILPIMIVSLVFAWCRPSRASVLWMPTLGVGSVVLAMRLLVLRVFGTEASAAQVYRGVMNDLFPELRSFALALHTVPREGLGDSIIGSVGLGFIPGRLAEALALNKEAVYAPIGSIILSSMYQFFGDQILGIRVGIAGEFYLGFGILGTVAVSLIVGALAHVANRVSVRGTGSDFVLAAVLASVLGALMPYGSGLIVTSVTLAVPAWLLARWANR